jgi:acetyl-CoA acetyltransferase
MSKVTAKKDKRSSMEANEREERDLMPLAPPQRHVARGVSASEIRKAYGITDEQMDVIRRELKAMGLL